MMALALMLLGLLLAGCNPDPTIHMHKAQNAFAGQQYGPALDEYNKVLELEPESRTALLGKGRSLYELKRYQEALDAFEKFLKLTEPERAAYRNERFDAEFYRDKCKQAMGEEVPQNPRNIPPPPMGE